MKKIFYSFALMAVVGLSSCSKDEVKLPDIAVNFAASETGIEPSAESVNVGITLSRAASADVSVSISYTAEGLSYGADFTSVPAASGNSIALTVPSGSTTASIQINKTGDLYDGTENIVFTIVSADNSVKIGEQSSTKLSFSSIVSTGGQMTLEGKTEASPYANAVYVDFSQNSSVSVSRSSWTLGFYCGTEFRVFLNPSLQMAAGVTSKSDIASVTVADTAGVPRLVANMMAGQLIPVESVDDLEGRLNQTVFAEISANASENKVYLVAFEGNSATPEDYYKVKVTRNGESYSVQYGKLGGGEIKSANIAKDAAYNMVCVSFADGTTSKPEPRKWDIQWSYNTGLTSMAGSPAVYWMQDYISSNSLANTQVAEVIIPTSEDTNEKKTAYFNNFTETSLAGLSFSTKRNTIGSGWREVGGMGGAAGIKTEKFYVVKDSDENYYKLRFLKMGVGSDGGERGRPQIEYKLVKAGN
ncbi:MAG: HmuY family protein [Prevotellaceae bacterium]|jgi:hypothetical protein|nr:HmuY family protein [Prevotellaceae bacterium]